MDPRTVARAVAALSLMTMALVLSACDPVIRHKTLTTFFDGVPRMPPADEYCQAYHQQQVLLEQQVQTVGTTKVLAGSKHEPYAEKRCDDCHDKAKGGLKMPVKELCVSCHTDLMTTAFAHGPAAVGDCISCHLPHSSAQPFLLLSAPADICSACHRETRQAAAMHERFQARGVICTECHNPHASDIRFFLY